MKTKAIVFKSPYEVSIEEYELRPLKEDEVLIKTVFSGVSPGTELRIFSGRQWGVSFPLIPGYENVGEVIEKGEKVDIKIGSKVYSTGTLYSGPFNLGWGGHVEYSICKGENLIVIPENTNLLHSVFTKTCAIALHGIERAKIKEKEKIAIVGQGLIGHLASQIAKIKGAYVIAIDTSEERLLAIKNAGVDFVINAEKENVLKRVLEITNGGVDVAVDVTGISSTVNETAKLIKKRPPAYTPQDDPNTPIGRLLVLGSYPDPIPFDYPMLFDKEIDIIVSRDCTYFDMLKALELIRENKINFNAIPFEIFDYKEAKIAYDKLINKKIVKAVFKWEEY